jgi:uncharacterized protein
VSVPVAPANRVEALDVLRGVALFGVLTVNLVTIFRLSLFQEFLHGPEDAWALAVSLGLEFKAVTLFSLLFGIGLEAQRERIDGFHRYILRRLIFLLVIGLVHLFLVWNGDVLTLYALCGLVVVPLLRLPTRALLGLATLLFVLQFVPVPYPPPFGTAADLREHVEVANRVYRYGTFVQALKFRIEEVRPMGILLFSIVPRTVGLFLLGACVWRWNLLRGDRRALSAIAIAGIALGTYATMIRANWASIVLALGYGGAIVLAARPLNVLAPLGRMAFTCYLAQSFILSFVFYGWGLGQFGHMSAANGILLAIAIYTAQAIASALWLRRFRFGPLEWVWRSFSYGKRV